ncbi:hypothetical protein BSIN_1572 [Burkholderia singularis]|uniref:Uncharacterized protein n=1 Tax=Burkholderia singularis TaxID=1503053 RepID=A0A238GZ73_9BURK|nr:hypothetical protein BSIN_1572 [Burkholderia singularis]
MVDLGASFKSIGGTDRCDAARTAAGADVRVARGGCRRESFLL